MGKKIQGAKLRALKRSKVALEELQEQQAEDAVLVNADDLFVIDRTGTSHIPHHLRPSKVHKATIKNNAKFSRNHLSSLDEQKVQKLLLQKQPAKQVLASTMSTSTGSRSRNHKTTSIQRQKTNFDLWQDDSPSVKVDTKKNIMASPPAADTSAMDTTSSETNMTATTSSSSSSILPRNVKFTAEGIRDIVVSTATAIKDTLWNRFMTQTAPGGIAPIHVVTKALPTSLSNKIKNPVITKVVGNTKHLIPIAKKKVAIDTSLTPGQSYHPDPVQHKQLLQTAIQIEVARHQALERTNKPISNGLSAETRAILMKDDSEDDDDDNDDEDGDGNANTASSGSSMAVGDIPKRLNKLTTAQRNKQKLRRQQEVILRKQKLTKQLLNDGEIPKYQKDWKRQQQKSTQKQLQKIQQQQTKLETNPLGSKIEIVQAQTNPILAPTLPIALPQQVASASSSLRTIQPKGSMITDRAYSLSSRHPSISPVIPTKRDTSMTATKTIKLAPHKHRKKRKLSMKGKRNSSTRGEDFEIMG